MRVLLAALLFAGCASGRSTVDPADAPEGTTPDAKAPMQPVDAHQAQPADAAAPDAYQCQVMTRELLTNPVLDLNPSGMGWVQQNIDNTYPIVTGDDGIVEQSVP